MSVRFNDDVGRITMNIRYQEKTDLGSYFPKWYIKFKKIETGWRSSRSRAENPNFTNAKAQIAKISAQIEINEIDLKKKNQNRINHY